MFHQFLILLWRLYHIYSLKINSIKSKLEIKVFMTWPVNSFDVLHFVSRLLNDQKGEFADQFHA